MEQVEPPREPGRRPFKQWFRESFVDAPPPAPLLVKPAGPTVSGELVAEYWKRTLQSIDGVRARAQFGYTIVSAIAAAFIGGAFFAGVKEPNPCAVVVAGLAILAWAATVYFYLVATTYTLNFGAPAKQSSGRQLNLHQVPDTSGEEVADPETAGLGDTAAVRGQAVEAIVVVQDERHEVVWRTQRANRVGLLAISLSIVTLATTWLLPGSSVIEARVAVTDAGCEIVGTVCNESRLVENASVDTSKLSEPFVEIELDDATGDGVTSVLLPRGEIRAIEARQDASC